jgi:hypothetical protein
MHTSGCISIPRWIDSTKTGGVHEKRWAAPERGLLYTYVANLAARNVTFDRR